jgi:hypothetical protein
VPAGNVAAIAPKFVTLVHVSMRNWRTSGGPAVHSNVAPGLSRRRVRRDSLRMNKPPLCLLPKCYKTFAQALPDICRPVMQSY